MTAQEQDEAAKRARIRRNMYQSPKWFLMDRIDELEELLKGSLNANRDLQRELNTRQKDEPMEDDDRQWAEQQENEDFAQDGELDNLDEESRI